MFKKLKFIKFTTSVRFSILITLACLLKCFLFIKFDLTLYPDSKSYLFLQKNIFKLEVDPERTPAYPFFIKLIRNSFESNYFNLIIWTQFFISCIGLYIFYLCIKNLTTNKYYIFLFTFVYALSVSMSGFDNCILTESLSLSSVILLFYLTICYFNNFRFHYVYMIFILLFFMVMLRPSFLIFFPGYVIIFVLCFLTKKLSIYYYLKTLLTASLVYSLIFIYVFLNDKQNGVNGLSQNLTFNQVANLISYNLYTKGDDHEIINEIQENLNAGSYPPFYKLATDSLYVKFSHQRIQKYVAKSIKSEPYEYFKHSILKLITLASTPVLVFYAPAINRNDKLINTLKLVFSNFKFIHLYLVLIIEASILFIQFIRHKKIYWLEMILFGFCLSQLFTNLLGAQIEYDRLFFVAWPAVSLISLLMIQRLMSTIFYYSNRNI